MASNFSKRKAVDKTDVQPSSPQSESEISKLRRENAYLKKTLHELACQKGEPSDSENNKLLLERILVLETLSEKNSQQILSRDQEIASLRRQLQSGGADAVAALQAQLNQQKLESDRRERLYQSLKHETEEVKNKLAAVSANCQNLENREGPDQSTADGQSATRNATVIQEHLKDALEKNQQWLAYDQQREAYVKAVLSTTCHLEQQLSQANDALQQKDKQANSEVKQALETQQHYEELLHSIRTELEAEQERETQGRRRVSQLQQLCEDRQQEVMNMRQQVQAARKELQEQRRRSGECVEKLRAERDGVTTWLEEERLRSAELLQQIQVSAKDLEDEKRDNQHLQRQLHKVLKELRKAKGRVGRRESETTHQEATTSELGAYTKLEKAAKESQQSLTSPRTAHSLLDESILECPNCRAQYPASHHRELLLHIDQCLG